MGMNSSAAESVSKQDSGTENLGKSTRVLACSDTKQGAKEGSPPRPAMFHSFMYPLKRNIFNNCLQVMQNVPE